MSVWLLFQVMMFYFNILAQIFFLVITRFAKFRTIRERLGYGGQKRYETDFLDFVKDDIQWFVIVFNQTCLFFAALAYRMNQSYSIFQSFTLITMQLIIAIFVVAMMFFTKAPPKFKKVFLPLFVLNTLLTIILTVVFFVSDQAGSLFWGSYVMFHTMIEYSVFLQMFIEYKSFKYDKHMW